MDEALCGRCARGNSVCDDARQEPRLTGLRPWTFRDENPWASSGHRWRSGLVAQMTDGAVLRRRVDVAVPHLAQGCADHKRQDGDRDNQAPNRFLI